jgi:hypothetical protein
MNPKTAIILIAMQLTLLRTWGQTAETLTNATIVELYKEGFTESLIVTKIRTAKNNFDVSLSGIKQLKADSIPQTVIETMLEYAEKNRADAAPDPLAPPLPPFVNTPMWLDVTTNELKPFERRVVNRKQQSSVAAVPVIGAIFGGGESSVSISDVSSAVLFELSQIPRIFIKVQPGTDPSSVVFLYNFNINYKKDQRELVIYKNREGVVSSNSGGALANIITNFKQVAADVYEVTPASALADGEYGFANSSLTEIYAFRTWKSGNGNTTPPPTFNRVKNDLMGVTVGGWDFDAQTRFDKVEQINLQQYPKLLIFTYNVSVTKPQKGADLRQQLTLTIRYNKTTGNDWALGTVEATN